MSDVSALYSAKAKSGSNTFFPQYDTPPRWDFDQGRPAPETYPLKELEACAHKALEQDGIESCGYFGSAGREEMIFGFAGLREQLAAWVAKRDGRNVGRENILLGNGSSGGLSLVANAFVGPGDGAVVEVTTFPYMRSYMESTGAKVMTAAMDDDGMIVESVEQRFREMQAEGLKPKVIYTIPSYHVPTGILMPLERRKKLLALAQKWGTLLVEDNCYHEIWYDKPTPPTLYSMDDSGLVVQSDSFSKMLAPGVRTGWIVGSPGVMQGLAKVRQDLGTSQFTSHVLSAWMAQDRLAPHLASVRPLYRKKRDIAEAALNKHCGKFVKFRTPTGGIFFWLELADGINGAEVRERALAEGVACRPGEKFNAEDSKKSYLRMSFLQVPSEEIERGVAVLGKAIAESIK